MGRGYPRCGRPLAAQPCAAPGRDLGTKIAMASMYMEPTKRTSKPYVRKSARIAFDANVTATVTNGSTFAGRFVDLSSGGACIDLPYRASKGETLLLYVERKDRGVGTAASVVGDVAWTKVVSTDAGDDGKVFDCDGFDFEVEGTGTETRRQSWFRIGIVLRQSAVTERWLAELQAPAEYTV